MLWEFKILLGWLGWFEEFVGFYLYLVSEVFSYMIGFDIVIDGGYICF